MERADAELVAATRRGNKEAFGQLVERYQQMVKRVVWQMTANEDLAKELAQESILQAYLSLNNLRDTDRFQSWLYGITLNVCRNYFRSQKVDYLSFESLTGGLRYQGLFPVEENVDPQEIVEIQEIHELVLRAVDSLSSKNREITLLFYYEDLSVREISALSGISISAIKSRLHQSRKQLKEKLSALDRADDFVTEELKRRQTMIKVTIADVVVQVKTKHRIVVLEDAEKQRALPIWIGPFEADSIAMTLKNTAVARPVTYMFVANILTATGAQLEEVRIEVLKDNTFYAIAKLRNGENVQEIDARPSDALALATQTGSPIYVSEEVMQKAGSMIPEKREEAAPIEGWYLSLTSGLRTNFPEDAIENLTFFTPRMTKVPEERVDQSAEENAERKHRESMELITFVFASKR
jgi:RNA polymerase sigma factor (sigma-70 family)